jgi:hypothetical protein
MTPFPAGRLAVLGARPGDVITAEARVLQMRDDKPVTTLETRIFNQDGVTVVDGTAVVWRGPVAARQNPSVGTGHGDERLITRISNAPA